MQPKEELSLFSDPLAVYLRSELVRAHRREAEIMGVQEATGLQLPTGMWLGDLIDTLQQVQTRVEAQLAQEPAAQPVL